MRQSLWDFVQRSLDTVLTLVTAVLWVPLLAMLVGVKALIDGRPVLFRHVRVGRHGQLFMLYKIRTTPAAYRPSEEDWPDDRFPPRTRFGRWLRQHDLDELPQLWNVLKGEMSLVGPRPETPFHFEAFSRSVAGYEKRLRVRPGLTGLAQVRGWRGNTSMAARVASDVEYVSVRGLRMYFSILVRTLGIEMRRCR